MIKVSDPDIREQDIARVAAVLRSGQLVQSIEVEAFESTLCEFSGLPHAIAVSSGTAALHLSLLALGIGPGDGVLVPAFTFPATANVVKVVGAEPLLCEVDPDTWVLTPKTVEHALKTHADKSIRALMVVHEFGQPANMRALAELAADRGLLLIEDAACALGTEADGYHVGYYADTACFSFHPRKAITTGEGGALLTRNTELAIRLRQLRNQGIERTTHNQLEFHRAGLNYRLTEFQAALGIAQLQRYPAELATRRRYAEIYDQHLAALPDLQRPQLNSGQSWQSYMVVLPEGENREAVMQLMRNAGIQTTIGAQALNVLPHIAGSNYAPTSFPIASRLANQGLVLPMYAKLSQSQIEHISSSLLRSLSS